MRSLKTCGFLFLVFLNVYGTNQSVEEHSMASSLAAHSESLDADHEKLNELAYKYAPLLYLHSKEKYFPTSFKKHLAYVSLNPVSLLTKDLNSNDFLEFLKNTQDTKNYKLLIRSEFIQEGRRGDLSSAVCYSNPHKVQRNGKNYIDIPYVFFYGYNGMPHSRNPIYNKIVQATRHGVHEGDVEHITVILNEDESLYGVYFDAHGQSEGRFYKKLGTSNLKLDDGYKLDHGRPIVFSALETHASYNRMGNLRRRARKNFLQKFASFTHLLPSDKTDQGFSLDCKAPGRLETFDLKWQNTWIAFQGKIGGVDGVGQRSFWTGPQWIGTRTVMN